MNEGEKIDLLLLLKNLQYYLLLDYSDHNIDDGTRNGIDQLIIMTESYIKKLSS